MLPLFCRAGGHNGKVLPEKTTHSTYPEDAIFPDVLQGITVEIDFPELGRIGSGKNQGGFGLEESLRIPGASRPGRSWPDPEC